ncbi:MAG: bifunctional riboflavin kinase/FAD synthetase [Bacillota bacterium]
MKMLRRPGSARAETAIAIGSFDGVHRGHAAILARVVEDARASGLASAVLTFEPLPREFFSPETAPPRIASLAERLAAIAGQSIEIAYVQRFDRAFASLSPEAFALRLRERHGARRVIVGPDFRYGARRAGDVERLRADGRQLGFEVDVIEAVTASNERISSTRVREALARADFAEAARLLGRPYAMCGHVVQGAKRGRELGFPTANIRLARPKPALAGIFAVKCYGAATRGLEGVASLGLNPAVKTSGPATLEAFLFDFSGDLYGRRITLEFVKKLRDEAHFASLDALAAQIRRDCDEAREIFRRMR